MESSEATVPAVHSTEALLSVSPKPWLSKSVPDDGYIHSNTARHLSFSCHGIELAVLILDARWTTMRAKTGEILALHGDFEILRKCSGQWAGAAGTETPVVEFEQTFGQIFRALRISWGRFLEGLRAFQFQVCGRLLRLRRTSIIVDKYLKSVETNTPMPYLVSLTPVFPELNDAQLYEIPVGGTCCCVACSPCGKYCVAGAQNDIVVIDAGTGIILRRLIGHTKTVLCLTFAAELSKIVSGGQDENVMVWRLEGDHFVKNILEGHQNHVTSVAVNSTGDKILSSSIDRSLRIWNARTFEFAAELRCEDAAMCTAISPNDQNIVLGILGGILRVVDSDTKDVFFEDRNAQVFPAPECARAR